MVDPGWPAIQRDVLAKVVEPLSQVWFVHDHVQLRFQDAGFTLNNALRLDRSEGGSIREGEPGFCDALVALIGARLVGLEHRMGDAFVLHLDEGTDVCVRLDGDAARGPEAAELPGSVIIFNGEA